MKQKHGYFQTREIDIKRDLRSGIGSFYEVGAQFLAVSLVTYGTKIIFFLPVDSILTLL